MTLARVSASAADGRLTPAHAACAAAPQLSDLLTVEDDSALAGMVCGQTGLPYWPQIRSLFLRMAISDFLYATPLLAPRGHSVAGTRALSTLGRSVLHNFGLRPACDRGAAVCIFSSGVGNQLQEGKWLNRLSDHFALAHPGGTLTFEDHFEWRWPFPRANERVLLHAPLQAATSVAGRLRERDSHRRQARELVQFVSGRAERILGWRPGAQREEQLVQVLARKIAALPAQLRSYEKVLSRIRPRVLLALAATYGPAAALMAAARRRGVVTAEYQHGVVAAGHDGYNFAPAIRQSAAYRETLPEHFLTYGDWWGGTINAPLRMTTIGNPHRSARLLRLPKAQAKDIVLVLSDGTEFEMYLCFAQRVAAQMRRPGLRVVIRPHPVERSQVASVHGRGVGNVSIDQNTDLYESLSSAHAVVSELSTALFEAVGVAERLFVWDTAKARFMFPVRPFAVVDSAEMLADLLSDTEAGRVPAATAEAIWAEGWESRYQRFLEQQGASPV